MAGMGLSSYSEGMGKRETVQEIYAAFGRGDIPSVMKHLRDDVEWEHDAVDHAIPWIRPGRGLANVQRFFEVVAGELEVRRFEVLELLEGEATVAAIAS